MLTVDLPSFLYGVCDLCVFLFFFRDAVRASSLACSADYCFIVTDCIYCHFWRINVNVKSVKAVRLSPNEYTLIIYWGRAPSSSQN